MKHQIKALIMLVVISLLVAACKITTLDTQPSDLGTRATLEDLVRALEKPGIIEFEKHLAADWSVPLSGLLNLEHPKSLEAGLEDRQEPIQIYTYSLTHPAHGTYLVDSGLSSRFVDIDSNEDVSWIVKKAMDTSKLRVNKTTASIAEHFAGISGVFLTHIHMDHIMGLNDLSDVPVYIGPGDVDLTSFINMATQGTTNRLLGTTEKLLEWQFDEEGIVDVFSDGSLWAIHSPGHTPGATAYLAMTTQGPQLMIGDATHTKWGWENGVEPGSYSEDIAGSKISLARLKKLAEQNQQIAIHPGHQSL